MITIQGYFGSDGITILTERINEADMNKIIQVINDNAYDLYKEDIELSDGKVAIVTTKFDTYATEEDPSGKIEISI